MFRIEYQLYRGEAWFLHGVVEEEKEAREMGNDLYDKQSVAAVRITNQTQAVVAKRSKSR